jgi:septal ring factor EnvC (AmiA/AmiB activator)
VIIRTMRTLLPVVAIVGAGLCSGPIVAQDAQQDAGQDPGSRYAQAVGDIQSLERFNRLLEEQVRSQEAEVASIERQLVDVETTNREVQPLMAQMVSTLDRFIQLDVPFLLEERTAVVDNLKRTMDRSDVSTKATSVRAPLRARSSSRGSVESPCCTARSTARRRAIGMRRRKIGSSTRAFAAPSRTPFALRRAMAPRNC